MREDMDRPHKFDGFKVKSVSDTAFKWAVAEKIADCASTTNAFLSSACLSSALFSAV